MEVKMMEHRCEERENRGLNQSPMTSSSSSRLLIHPHLYLSSQADKQLANLQKNPSLFATYEATLLVQRSFFNTNNHQISSI
ncbi:hypothetical protein L6452_40242 [Arctium lappa]|uniref:Uncharacterized protein n=1 Tax=Arctium lappa TaxID=4217 RepID=A0ACB8XKU8_ARCLA|nr:hypothetical protein L6452_40242 [Arctium lappa]